MFPGLRAGTGGPEHEHGGGQVPPQVHTTHQFGQRGFSW